MQKLLHILVSEKKLMRWTAKCQCMHNCVKFLRARNGTMENRRW